jgi:exopolyphosphatase/guanosine-5'-triphosphate,3'-diphosphate pyrophosphatase
MRHRASSGPHKSARYCLVCICSLLATANWRDYMRVMPVSLSKSQLRGSSPATSIAGRHERRGKRAFGGIDLGTNNCRMLTGTPTASGFQVVDSFSRVVRLGEGLYETGRLSDAAMQRAINALKICADRARRWDIGAQTGTATLRAIATEACRQAENGAEFVARANAETGLKLDIITPREEAELVLESCTSLICQTGRRALLFDIGGGSTEIAWVRVNCDGSAPDLIGYVSIPVGVVTLTERCADACYSESGFGRVVEDVAKLLRPFEAIHRIAQEIRQGGVLMIGTSGTVTTLAGISLKLDRYRRDLIDGISMSREAVDDALIHARELGRSGLSLHPCIGADRVEYVLPGCAIFAAIQELWPTPAITVADRGLREGMLLRMMRAARSG